MPKHAGLTLGVASLVGTTVGFLVLWKFLKNRRRRLCSAVDHRDTVVLDATGHDTNKQCTLTKLKETPKIESDGISVVEKILVADTEIVSKADEWETVWLLLKKDLDVYPVLGMDCEWVSVDEKASSVSLLQMASFSGFCVLVRLPQLTSSGCTIPKTLLELLANSSVLKVGVGCWEDSSKLLNDYGLSVKGCVDIRYLAMRHRRDILQNTLSLKSLSETILSFPLDKSFQLRCSNWDVEELTQDQAKVSSIQPDMQTRSRTCSESHSLFQYPSAKVLYAARDAQVSVALFLHLLGFFSADLPCPWEPLLGKCQGLIDIPFKGKGNGISNGEVSGSLKQRKEKAGDQSTQNSQDSDPRRNKRKQLGVGYSARKSPLYDNCFLHAPDGQPLCTCDRKKAQWYLDKGIGDLVSAIPFIVKLRFEPSGRPESNADYYLTIKENLCVVCGKRESYIRKNIVPHEYRRHFPVQMKDHNSHDVLLLCTSCHAVSNYYDSNLKQKLAEEFNAPIGCEEGVRLLEDPIRRQVRSAARALLNVANLPKCRKEELISEIKAFYNMEDVTEETIKEAAGLETRLFNETYTPHGLKVVQTFALGGLRPLMELEKRWRQHFLDTMHPKHLPQQWSVDHNHSKLLKKYGDDLVVQLC
ncbi:exonuclease 3'-5' domain containing 2 [Xenopus laevis]|uniref:Exonuclease 3'-5' domain-containing protein 2 n=1 Tax=Xenopus laevis TaxID=8355 RepID=A0A8J0PSR7_XENLA|nr:exonuclease 3'-5' domain containing 2 L homeolog [Xenopus laevis]